MRKTLEKIPTAVLAATLLIFGSAQAAMAQVGTVTLPTDTATDNQSFFEKVGNFASENATWFIIGIIVLAVVLATIFILRGRKKGASTPAVGTPSKAAAQQPGQDAPSAAEIKRRRRAAMQRAREEERLRRKAGVPPGASPAQALDPVAAEKHAAKAGSTRPPQPPVPPTPPVSPEAPTQVSPAPGGIGAGAVVGGVAAAAAGAAAAGSMKQDDEAEARLREKVEEIKAGQSAVAPSAAQPVQSVPPEAPATAAAIPATPKPPVPADLAEAEARIRADRQARDRALQEAEERLRLVEERAEAAERRAAFAEQLAELKAEEGEQERRLREVMERMDRAEHRARQAELRAEAAERVASDALTGGATAAPGGASAAHAVNPPPAEPPVTPAPVTEPPSAPANPGQAGSVNINTASFEELRGADFSVTQATRVLAYRERFGGYGSVDDLARVPGFSPEVIAALRDRISI